jgi:hypothetical protein
MVILTATSPIGYAAEALPMNPNELVRMNIDAIATAIPAPILDFIFGSPR